MASSPFMSGLQASAEEARNLPITVLMNVRSGNESTSAARAAIDAALAGDGRDVQIVLARHPGELSTLARQAADSRPGILAAAGGDGTLNAVAAVALERDLPLAVIPLGTFNYFARGLGIPLDTAAATRLITEGVIRRVAVGEVNGQLFLNNASIGLYRRLIEQRESHKRRFGRNRLVALLSGLLTLWQGHHPYRLQMEADGQPVTLTSPTVFFGRSVLQMEQLGLDEAVCVARGELAILALREVNRFRLLSLILRGAFANLETARDLRQFCAVKVNVDWLDGRSGKIKVAIDGELMDCTLPLLIEAVPDALQVVVPSQPEAVQ